MSDIGATRYRAMMLTGIMVALGVLAVSLAIAEQRTRVAVRESEGWLSHTREVVREFQATQTLIEEAETGQRGFLLTGREMYLSASTAAEIGRHLTLLRTLTADNPSQQARLTDLEATVTKKLSELARTIDATRAGRRDDAIRIVETNEGRDLMESIHTAISAGVAEEDRLLTDRQAIFATSLRRRGMFALGLVLAVTLTVAIISVLLLRLGRVRTLARICAWSKTVEYQGQWITFDEYLRLRFEVDVTHGISPLEAERLIMEHGDPRR